MILLFGGNPKMSKNVAAKVQIFFQITKTLSKKQNTNRANPVFTAFSFLLTKNISSLMMIK